jgi:hypothetical protein
MLNRTSGRRRENRYRFRPQLETLTSRILPAVDVWTGANYLIDIDWSDGGNWSLGRAPMATDSAFFTSHTNDPEVIDPFSVIDQNYTIGGMVMDSTWGASLTVGGFNDPVALTLAAGGNSEWDSGTIFLQVGEVSLVNNGTLTLGGIYSLDLSGGGTFQNNGTIVQAGAAVLELNGTVSMPTTLLNEAGATYDFQSGSKIGNGVSAGGMLVNAGLVEATGGASSIFVPLNNMAGTLAAAAAHSMLTLSGGTTATDGTYEAVSGGILNLCGQANFTEAGTFTGTGTGKVLFDAGNSTLAIDPSGVTFNIPSGLTFQWNSGTIKVPLDTTLVYNGTLTIGGTTGVTLAGGGTFQNNGTIDQTDAGELQIDGTGSIPTTLLNEAGATYDFQSGSKIGNGGSAGGGLVNAGLVEATGGASTIFVPLNNMAGTLAAAAAHSMLTLSGGTTATDGTYEAVTGGVLDLCGQNNFTQAGTFTGTGTGEILFDAGDSTLVIDPSGGTFNIPSGLTFQWNSGTIDVPQDTNLVYNGTLTIGGAVGVILAGGGTFQNNGTITQSGMGNLEIDGSGSVVTNLVIPAGSTYDLAGNTGIVNGQGGGGIVTNSGTIEKTAGGATSFITTVFNNTGGTLEVTSGTLTLNTVGGENTGGIFDVLAGAVLDLTGGGMVNYSGTYTGMGMGLVELAGGVLSVTGGTNGATFNLPGNSFAWSGGTIDTNGRSLTILGNVGITSVNGSEQLDSGTSSGGELIIGSSSAAGTLNDIAAGNRLDIGPGTTLLITSRGTVNLGDVTIEAGGDGSAISNQGSLIKSAGTGVATVSVFLDNENSVTVATGMLTFAGTVDQVVNNQLTGGSWTVIGSTANAELSITTASFNTIDPGVIVVLNGPFAGFANLGSVTTNEGTLSLLNGATLTTTGSFTNMGTLNLIPGPMVNSMLAVNGTFKQTALGALDVSVGGTSVAPTFGSISSTGAVTLAGRLVVTSTVVVKVGASFDLLVNASHLAVGGIFAGLAQGAKFAVKVGTTTMTFQVSYKGGSNHRHVVIARAR